MVKQNEAQEEQRLFKRTALRTAARVTRDDSHSIEGKCRDFSRTGLLLEMPEPLEQGSVVGLTLMDPLSRKPLMSGRAQVVRSAKSAHGHYTVGLILLPMV